MPKRYPRRTNLNRRKRFRRGAVRVYGRGKRFRRVPRGPRQTNFFKVTRETVPITNTVSNGTPGASGGVTFNLAMMPGYSDFTGLFDQYMIKSVVCMARLVYDPESSLVAGTATANQNGWFLDMISTVDHDNAGNPTNWTEVAQYSKAKSGILSPNRWYKYRLFPTLDIQVYRGIGTVGYMNTNGYCDLNNTDVPWYAWRWIAVTPGIVNVTQDLKIELKYKMTVYFRNTR